MSTVPVSTAGAAAARSAGARSTATGWSPSARIAPSPTSAAPFDRLARLSPRITVPLLLGAAVALGLLAGHDVKLAIAASGAAVFVLFLLVDLPVAIGIWVIALFLAGVPGTQGAPTGTSVLLLAGWAGTLANRGPQLRTATVRARWALAATALMMVWSALSMVWAENPTAVVAAVQNWGIAVAALPVIVTACSRVRDVLIVAGAFVAGATLSVLAGLMSGTAAAPSDAIAAAEMAAGRLHVGITDPNYLAANIVASLVLVAGLLGVRQIRAWRPWLLAAIPVLLYGLVATQSRGGIIAAVAAALMAAIVLRDFRKRIVIGVGVAIGMLAAFLAAQPRALERLTQDDSSGTGRTDLWSAAWAVARDHPVLGVGTGNFPTAKVGYADSIGFIERPGLIVDMPMVTHDIWLQALSENGAIGLLLLLAVLVACVSASFAAARRFANAGQRDLANLGRALGVGQLASLVASTFIANAGDRVFWVLLALGPVLLAVAPRRERPKPGGGARGFEGRA